MVDFDFVLLDFEFVLKLVFDDLLIIFIIFYDRREELVVAVLAVRFLRIALARARQLRRTRLARVGRPKRCSFSHGHIGQTD